ncbi:AHH domain-containing protein [Myxococcus sp. MxC21-1]|uniref:AHH domain-containing protein n=1 Tax=Myxococcus sp. MxC21-1 TaxID=3041439 RepID=UPI002931DE48|nr:AHH domain-containing protein [Myxococcus sp. MxC21-1]WNZ65940.1 AHH domain-containing protein [Myxococcus sp. MxC21-1]
MGAGESPGAAAGAVGGIQGDPEGEIHHICTNKNDKSDRTGGPWTPRFERFFMQAGMKLSDPANLVRIRGHKGSHPAEYHQEVFRRLDLATKRCRGETRCRALLVDELAKIARELVREGSELRGLITKGTRE